MVCWYMSNASRRRYVDLNDFILCGCGVTVPIDISTKNSFLCQQPTNKVRTYNDTNAKIMKMKN